MVRTLGQQRLQISNSLCASSAPLGSRDSHPPESRILRVVPREIIMGMCRISGSHDLLERHVAKEAEAHEPCFSLLPAPAPAKPEHLPEGSVAIRDGGRARHPPFARPRYSDIEFFTSVCPYDLQFAIESEDEIRITPWTEKHVNARPRAATSHRPPGSGQTPRGPDKWRQESCRQPAELPGGSCLSISSGAGVWENTPGPHGCTLGQQLRQQLVITKTEAREAIRNNNSLRILSRSGSGRVLEQRPWQWTEMTLNGVGSTLISSLINYTVITLEPAAGQR